MLTIIYAKILAIYLFVVSLGLIKLYSKIPKKAYLVLSVLFLILAINMLVKAFGIA